MREFTDRNGNVLTGTVIYQYSAFEGGHRLIIQNADGKQYRCVWKDGKLTELVV